jgi:mRNA interferase MazF
VARVLRGEVYWADPDPTRGHEQAGKRPVLVLSHEAFNARLGVVIALAVTSRPQPAYPLSHRLRTGDLPRESWVMMYQARTISTERLGERIGAISADELQEIVDGLVELVG